MQNVFAYSSNCDGFKGKLAARRSAPPPVPFGKTAPRAGFESDGVCLHSRG